MASINNIPIPYLQGYKQLFLLNDDEFTSIIEGLSITSLTSSIKKLATIVTESSQLDNEIVRQIFLSVGSLTLFIEKGTTIGEIVDDVYVAFVNDIAEVEEELDGISIESGKQIFTQRLSILLKTERLYYAAKSSDLMHEYPNVFINARTITDIRPVFNLDLDESPKAGLIIHNLHIHYRRDQESEHKDFFIALDSEDLKKLKDQLLRAEKKENSLKSIFNNAGMINLTE